MNNDFIPSYKDICEVHEQIKKHINKTPVFTCSSINKILNCKIYFKCENFQKTGAFKYRGATNAVMQLSHADTKNGVATHSSGNHAAALSKAALLKGIKAYIVMPKNSAKIKIDAVKNYGGIISFCDNTLQAREDMLNSVINNTGAVFIHPYNSPTIIAGQATAAKELLEEIPKPDFLIAPVGGGGLLSGSLISVKNIYPKCKVIGAEPIMANDAWLSFNEKKLIPQTNPQTIADGLRTSLGDITFKVIISLADNILCVSEDSIIKAMYLIWERMKIIIEPSSAAALAVVLEHNKLFENKKVAIILSGGNCKLNLS